MKKQIQIALLALAMSPLMALAEQTFTTPDQAASALVNAVTQKDDAELDKLLGDNWQQFLPPDGVDQDAVDRFLRDWPVSHRPIPPGWTLVTMAGDCRFRWRKAPKAGNLTWLPGRMRF